MSALPDSATWILNMGERGPAAALDGLLQAGQVVTCGPVAAELLVGTPATRRGGLWTLLARLPWVDLDATDWRRVGETGALLRERGALVPLTDVEIAVAAAKAGAELWSDDAHFDRIGAVMPDLRRFRRA